MANSPGGTGWPGDDAGFRTLVDSIDEGFCILEPTCAREGAPAGHRFVEASAGFEELTGLRDVRGRGLGEAWPQQEAQWSAALARIAAVGAPVRFELPAGAAGRSLDVHAFPCGGRSGTVAALLRDVGARRSADEQLREAERLSHVLHGSSQGFWDWTFASGRVVFSRTFAAMLGYELAEMPPSIETWKALVHPEDLAAVTARAQASMRADPATMQYDDEYRVRHKDGRWLWIHVRGKVVERDPAGGPVRAAGTSLDITARRQADEALRAALAENEKLVAELRDALQNVKTLSGFLPICMHCKKIRDDQGYWERIEHYISTHTDALFSHGLCPDCLARHYPDVVE